MRRFLGVVLASVLLFSCGSSLQSNSGAPEQVSYNPVERSYLVFDPFSTKASEPLGIPFPNDLFWLQSSTKEGVEPVVQFDTASVSDPAQKALLEAVNQLRVKGLSPNTPIFVPLSADTPLNLSTVRGRFKLIDVTALGELLAGNQAALPLVDQTDRLFVRQEGRFLKFYPVKPLEAGHHYLFVLINGIEDSNGEAVLPPQVYNELESQTPLSDPQLEQLRELYQSEIYGKLFPALNSLYEKGLISLPSPLNADTVLESFTFYTADKTLSLADLGAIKAYLEGEVPALSVTGLPYSSVGADYGSLDPDNATASPLYAVFNLVQGLVAANPQFKALVEQGYFPAFSISKLKELLTLLQEGKKPGVDFDLNDYYKLIPVYFGNGELFNGTLYIFQHGLGGDRARAQALLEDVQFPVAAIDLPYHGAYTSMTNNQQPNPACLNDEGEATGKCFLTGNVAADRVNIYQAVFNLRLLELMLKAGLYDVNGDGIPDQVQHLYFVGQSMGAITGSIFAAYGAPEKTVLNVGGANYVSIIDAALNELIEGLLTSTGLKKNTNGYAVTLGLFQMVLDPADPAYIGTENSNSTIIQSAYGDTVVPYVSNLSLAVRTGFSAYREADLDNPQALPGWYMFGNETNWVTHSFLTRPTLDGYPEVEGHTTEEFVLKAEKAARLQIERFFSQ